MVDPSKKVVILCEGQHDCFLVQEILGGQRVRYASKEEIQKTPRAGETKIINKFYRDDGLKYLIKDEDGKAKCIDSFLELYKNDNPKWNFVVILDDDEGRTIKSFRKKALDALSKDLLDPHKDHDCIFVTRDNRKHPIFFIPFSLEAEVKAATNRNLDNGKQDEQKRNIRRFLEESDAPWVDLLYSTLTSARSS